MRASVLRARSRASWARWLRRLPRSATFWHSSMTMASQWQSSR